MTVRLPGELSVVSAGLPLFADAISAQGRPVQQVDWRIPAGGDATAVAALQQLYGPRAEAIDRANAEVVRRLDEGVPTLVGIAVGGDTLPGFDGRMLLHCGPALAWEQVCDPLCLLKLPHAALRMGLIPSSEHESGSMKGSTASAIGS